METATEIATGLPVCSSLPPLFGTAVPSRGTSGCVFALLHREMHEPAASRRHNTQCTWEDSHRIQVPEASEGGGSDLAVVDGLASSQMHGSAFVAGDAFVDSEEIHLPESAACVTLPHQPGVVEPAETVIASLDSRRSPRSKIGEKFASVLAGLISWTETRDSCGCSGEGYREHHGMGSGMKKVRFLTAPTKVLGWLLSRGRGCS